MDKVSFEIVAAGLNTMGFVTPHIKHGLVTAQEQLQALNDFSSTNAEELQVRRNWRNQWRVIIEKLGMRSARRGEFGTAPGPKGTKTSKAEKRAKSIETRNAMKGRKVSEGKPGRK